MSGYDWNDTKAERNRRRHEVTFEEAETVIDQPLAHRTYDLEHSDSEVRMKIIGWSAAGRLQVVVVSPSGPRPRIISARRASKRERDAYTDR
jgi:uncharacterized protein